jgi:hypothetical protein
VENALSLRLIRAQGMPVLTGRWAVWSAAGPSAQKRTFNAYRAAPARYHWIDQW